MWIKVGTKLYNLTHVVRFDFWEDQGWYGIMAYFDDATSGVICSYETEVERETYYDFLCVALNARDFTT